MKGELASNGHVLDSAAAPLAAAPLEREAAHDQVD
jgi:hypothetical protein